MVLTAALTCALIPAAPGRADELVLFVGMALEEAAGEAEQCAEPPQCCGVGAGDLRDALNEVEQLLGALGKDAMGADVLFGFGTEEARHECGALRGPGYHLKRVGEEAFFLSAEVYLQGALEHLYPVAAGCGHLIGGLPGRVL